MQAMQTGVFFYLPSILLSGFMFPFHAMPAWARAIGEALPLTHFLRCPRASLLDDESHQRDQHRQFAIA
jgi:ABC-2 type transport system permease protein